MMMMMMMNEEEEDSSICTLPLPLSVPKIQTVMK